MRNLKWKYDSKNKLWWIDESTPYANNGYTIRKVLNYFKNKPYYLEYGYQTIGFFKKLSNAKKVADLLENG